MMTLLLIEVGFFVLWRLGFTLAPIGMALVAFYCIVALARRPKG